MSRRINLRRDQKFSINTSLERGDDDNIEDIDVTIHFIWTPGCKGSTDGRFGPKLEPDEPAGVEEFWVTTPDGKDFQTTKEEDKFILELCENHMEGYFSQEPEYEYGD